MRKIALRVIAIVLAWLARSIVLQAQTAIPSNDYLTGLVYANGKYLTVGHTEYSYPFTNGVAYTSMDGTNWSRQVGNLSPGEGLAWGNDKYVSFGLYHGTNHLGIGGWMSYYQTSTNGTNWIRQETGLPWQLNRILFANGRFVAVGNGGTILTSTDGFSWNYPSSQTEYDLRDVAYGNGRFVVVGSRGAVLTSTNGLFWTSQFAGTIGDINGIAFENGQFVAHCNLWQNWATYMSLLASPDGVTWTNTYQALNPISTDHSTKRIFSGNGLFLLRSGGSELLTSANGTQWRLGNFGTADVNDVAYIGDRFYAVGRGTILTSLDGSIWFNQTRSNVPPTITAGTRTIELFAGQTCSLNATVSANPSPHCQWQFNGTNLPGANSTDLYFRNVTTNQAGGYRLIASNAWRTATSEVFTVTVKLQAPVFLESPTNNTVLADQGIHLYAEVQAGPPAVCQWYFDGAAIPNATNALLYLPSVSIHRQR